MTAAMGEAAAMTAAAGQEVAGIFFGEAAHRIVTGVA
jgi:hypothetical protein